jgi:molecular chaperone DnaK
MYKKASASAGPQSTAGPSTDGADSANAKTDEKVVDAEFEEVDKDKK